MSKYFYLLFILTTALSVPASSGFLPDLLAVAHKCLAQISKVKDSENDDGEIRRLPPGFKSANVNASTEASEYIQPNGRSVWEYNKIFTTSKWSIDLLVDMSSGGVIADCGAGRGQAMLDIVLNTPSSAVVLNTQDFRYALGFYKAKGIEDRYIYQLGWVEENIAKYKNHFDRVTDLWGAFAYSTTRVELLEMYYRALKIGGVAYVLVPSSAVPLIKGHDQDREYFFKWLKNQFPKIFDYEYSTHPHFNMAIVLKITKSDENMIRIPFDLISSHVIFRNRNFAVPSTVYKIIQD